jgi:glycosyltransferase involved in cell wall biosynthesis
VPCNSALTFANYNVVMKKRIVIIADAAYPSKMGGVEKWLHHLSLKFKDNDYEVVYLNNLNQNIDINEVHYISFRNKFRFDSTNYNRSFLSVLVYTFFVFKWLLLNSSSKDVIYVHQTPIMTVIVARFVYIFKKFTVLTEWIEIWTLSNWKMEIGKFKGFLGFVLQNMALFFSQNVVTASQNVFNSFRLKYPKRKLLLLSGQYFHKRSELNFNQILKLKDNSSYLIVSRLSREKNVDLALQLFAKIKSIHPSSHLSIVGSGLELQNLKKFVLENNLIDNVIFETNLSESKLSSYYLKSKYLLHLSRREGFGLVVGEAASFGVIPILLRGSQNESVNRCSNFGLVFDRFDLTFMTDQILNCDYDNFAKRAFEYFEENLEEQDVQTSSVQIMQFANEIR